MEPLTILTKARTVPDVVDMPARKALVIDGKGAPEDPLFARSIHALYGVAYTLKFARKRRDEAPMPIAPLEGDWWVGDGAEPKARSSWRWRVRIGLPDDVTAAEVGAAITEATTRKGGKLFGSPEAARVRLETVPPHRYGRILHVGPYAAEPESFDKIGALLGPRGLQRRPWHTEVYLSDPRRTAPDRLRTTLLVQLD